MSNEVILWTIVSALIVAIAIGILTIVLVKRKEIPPDYFAIFIMGVLWVVIGVLTQNVGLIFLGVVFGCIGFLNKNKWKENNKSWKHLNKEEKFVRGAIAIVLGVLVVAGILAFYMAKPGVDFVGLTV